jgi:hypothetical protein
MEAAVKSMKHHLRRTLGSHIAAYEEPCTLLAEIEACLNSRPLCTLSRDPFNSTYLSPGYLPIGKPLTQLLLLTILMSNAIDFPDSKPTNYYNSSGNDGHPIISRVCSNANAGKGDPLTFNQVTWSY